MQNVVQMNTKKIIPVFVYPIKIVILRYENMNFMGVSKTEDFTDSQNELARLAKAIAHPARIAILEMLAMRKGCICNDIVDELPLAQATISQHLKGLKDAGLIVGEVNPPKICYAINLEKWKQVQEALSGFCGGLISCSCC